MARAAASVNKPKTAQLGGAAVTRTSIKNPKSTVLTLVKGVGALGLNWL